MLVPLSSDDARRLREFFGNANFTDEHFRKNPSLREFRRRVRNRDTLLEITRDPSALNVLLRWFFLGVPQEAEAVAGLVPEWAIPLMLRAGLLRRDENRLTANVLMTPWADYLFAADVFSRLQSEQSADMVLWPNPTSSLLQQFAIRRPSRDTLDLGTGCGVQGVMAAAYSDRVCSTDLNPRAEEFVVFNAHLNGVTNIEYLGGDTFEPVKGRTFDLILANPPFCVTPTGDQLYCENGMELDQYCRRIVREAAQHLNEGGYFQAVVEWAQVRGQAWHARLAEWLEGTQCDAWILRSYTSSAVAYAQERIRETLPQRNSFAKLEEWMAYYGERGVEEIHGGVFAMRRRSGKNWLRIEEVPVTANDPFGENVLEVFATQDVLLACPQDDQLLGIKPRLSPHAQLEQKSRVSGGRWAVDSLLLRLTGAVPAAQAVEVQVADFLSRCNGDKTLAELAQDLSAEVNAAPDQVRHQCCAIVRHLAEQRFVQLSL
jgi:methylase of polypeptide subunit release factors